MQGDRQQMIDLDVGEGTTVYQAAEQSVWLNFSLKLILKQFQWVYLVSVLKRPPPRSFIRAIGWSCIDL